MNKPSSPPTNPLLELALTVVLPSIALDYLSAANRLGPFWALVVSLIFPLGFGVWCWVKKQGWNVFSVLGLVTVLLSGTLGLLQLDAFWIGIKESSISVMIGLAFPLSHRWGKPLINAMIMQPHLINLRALNASLVTPGKKADFNQALSRASWGMCLGMIASSVGNFFFALYILAGKEPGSEAFVKGLATLNWASMIVIGVPLLAVVMIVFFSLIRSIQRITGLERDDLLNPGTTVKRTVNNSQ